MKRIILYAGILGLMLAAPAEQMNIGKLIPVQTISVYMENSEYVIEADTGDRGEGETPEQALQNMKEKASGIIYLDTAKYLLLTQNAKPAMETIRKYLREDVRLCEIAIPIDIEKASEFLDVKAGLPKLKQWELGQKLPVLGTDKESYIFLKKVEKIA